MMYSKLRCSTKKSRHIAIDHQIGIHLIEHNSHFNYWLISIFHASDVGSVKTKNKMQSVSDDNLAIIQLCCLFFFYFFFTSTNIVRANVFVWMNKINVAERIKVISFNMCMGMVHGCMVCMNDDDKFRSLPKLNWRWR